MTCENGHLHPPPDFGDGPGRAEAGKEELQPACQKPNLWTQSLCIPVSHLVLQGAEQKIS